jgi:hypothetical protein
MCTWCSVAKFFWDARRARYRYQDGSLVPAKSVRFALDKALSSSSRRVYETSVALKEGRISLRSWEQAMRKSIKDTQLYSAAMARGGWQNMSKRDFGRTGPLVRRQYAYLKRFAAQIEVGATPLDGVFLRRAELYTEAGWSTYTMFEELNHRERGYDQEKNVLDPSAKHCRGCRLVASYGWVVIGSLTPIGMRPCKNRDRCHMIYRKRPGRGRSRRREITDAEFIGQRGIPIPPELATAPEPEV